MLLAWTSAEEQTRVVLRKRRVTDTRRTVLATVPGSSYADTQVKRSTTYCYDACDTEQRQCSQERCTTTGKDVVQP